MKSNPSVTTPHTQFGSAASQRSLALLRDPWGLLLVLPSLVVVGLRRKNHLCFLKHALLCLYWQWTSAKFPTLPFTPQLKPFLVFSFPHNPNSKGLHCNLTETEQRVMTAFITALHHWVPYALSLLTIGSLRIRDVYGTRETDVQILILLIAMYDLGYNIWSLPSAWQPG